jgi:hypothetical protein
MIHSLTVDVAALQRLSETGPLPRHPEFGLCDGTCALGSCAVLVASCVVAQTCGSGTVVSPE